MIFLIGECLSVDAGVTIGDFQDAIASSKTRMRCITCLGGNPKTITFCECYLGGRRYDCEISNKEFRQWQM